MEAICGHFNKSDAFRRVYRQKPSARNPPAISAREDLRDASNSSEANEVATGLWLQLLLTAESYVFFAFFWRIKGQTLGMQVWKIKTVKSDGAVMDYPATALRLITATLTLFPLGLIWMLVDPARLALYDRLSRTKVIYLGSKPHPSEQV